jgi:Tfp pilus assembly protein PilX
MWRDDRGMALVLVLLCAMLFLALGGALVTVVSSEATISATFRESAVALSAADAAIVRVLPDLAAAHRRAGSQCDPYGRGGLELRR